MQSETSEQVFAVANIPWRQKAGANNAPAGGQAAIPRSNKPLTPRFADVTLAVALRLLDKFFIKKNI